MRFPAPNHMKPPISPIILPDSTYFIDFGKNYHTNPSLMRMNDEWIMLIRDKMGVSNLLITRLDDDMNIKEIKPFNTKPFQDKYKWGTEDPRLFWCNDKLHYTYHGSIDNGIRTIIGEVNQYLAPTSNQQEIGYKPGPEKNWTFFPYNGKLHAITNYSPKFNIIIYADGVATDLYTEDKESFKWPYGQPRGGTPAIRVGEEFYTVFQSHVIKDNMPRYYCAAFAKFSAKPPFKVTHISQPILVPDEYRDWGYSVVFPAGLQLFKGKWYISYGHMDAHCRVSAFDFKKIESILCPV